MIAGRDPYNTIDPDRENCNGLGDTNPTYSLWGHTVLHPRDAVYGRAHCKMMTMPQLAVSGRTPGRASARLTCLKSIHLIVVLTASMSG